MKRGRDDDILSPTSSRAGFEPESPGFYFASEDPDEAEEDLEPELCSRCSAIDILGLSTRRPITVDPHDNIYQVAQAGIVEDIEELNLGPARALVVEGDCPFCQLLRDMLPSNLKSSDKDVYLLSCLAIHRFEPSVYTWEALETEHGPGEVMYLYLAPKSEDGPFPLADTALEAVAHAVGSEHALGMGMLARRVDWVRVDLNIVKKWAAHCMEYHGDICNHEPPPEPSIIRLIDVESRCIVNYQKGCKYLCLSYVWGDTPRPRIDQNEQLPQLPQTIEDSILFVKRLGKQYLWVDSVCINQGNATDKKEQIAVMHQIYANAWATLVALTGESADSGLPRVGFAGRKIQPEFSHGRIRLLGVMKTLWQQVTSSIWATRAWTFQEALLSPRCLYFTPEQLYFSCNMTQFCESIDEDGSAFQRMTYDKLLEALEQDNYNELGVGGFRDPSCIPFDRKFPSRWRIYSDIVNLYSERRLTFESDAFDAIRAALAALNNSLFPKGFFYGLPMECLAAAIVSWVYKNTSHRRREFPSWSWLGWVGTLHMLEGVFAQGNRQLEPPFRVYRWANGGLDLIYGSYPFTLTDLATRKPPSPPKWYRGLGSDPVLDLTYGIDVGGHVQKFEPDKIAPEVLPMTLFIECLVYHPKAIYTTPWYIPMSERSHRLESSRVVLIGDVACIVTCESELTAAKLMTDPEGYLFPKSHALILARRSTICQYHFVLIEYLDTQQDESVDLDQAGQLRATRVGTVSIHFQDLGELAKNHFRLPPTLGVDWWPTKAADRMHKVFPPGNLKRKLVALE